MPFSVVLTEESNKQLITLVPSNWVKDDNLFWPNIRSQSEIDRWRREQKQPGEEWLNYKCIVKAHGIQNFAEGVKIENLYASFEDTEDEERYNKNRAIKRKHPTFKAVTDDLLDLNSYFEDTSKNIDTIETNTEFETPIDTIETNTEFETPIDTIETNTEFETPITENVKNCLAMDPEHDEKSDDKFITVSLAELNSLIADKNALTTENEMLKESSQRLQALEQQTQRGFQVVQVQLDKLFELMQQKLCNNEIVTTVSSNLINDEEIIAQKNIRFPLQSKDELDTLEKELDKDFEKTLVKHFSKVCGTSGQMKVGKIGLQLVRQMFTDELLNQFTWKGIKGSTKVPFSSYIKIRNLFFKIIHLADDSSSAKDADALLQNSAIKHSGQRIKRKSCEIKKTMPKKKKVEVKAIDNTSDTSCSTDESRKVTVLSDVKITEGKKNKGIDNTSETRRCSSDESRKVTVLSDVKISEDKENKGIDNTSDTRRCSSDESRKVTVLSDVKINKIMDSKHETKMLNISFDDLLSSPVLKQKDESSNSTPKISFKL